MLVRSLVALFFAAVLGVASHASAHDTNFAFIKIIRLPSNVWSFELNTPLYELDRSMRQFNAERSRDLKDLTVGTPRYKELIVEYVRTTFMLDHVALNDSKSLSSKPNLGPGRIKLGNHESVLIFTIENMPAAPRELTLRLPFMANNAGQHNILWLIDSLRTQRHIFNEDNHFTVSVTELFEGDASQYRSERTRKNENVVHASTSR